MIKRRGWKRLAVLLAVLLLGFSFVAPSLHAKGGGAGRSRKDSPGPGFKPKGWEQGKKEGWKGLDEPPGLAKQDKIDRGKAQDKGKKHEGRHRGKKEEKKENKKAQEREKEKEEK